MPILNSLVSWIIKQRIHQIDFFKKYPVEVQNEWIGNLIDTAKNTEWGKKYDYKSIRTITEFKERVPVLDYEGIKPYINRQIKGEQNILWPSKVKWFAKSSGTTNDKSKFIPVTTESLEECHFKGGKDLFSIYCHNQPESKLFEGKALTLGGSHQINNLSSDSFYGDLSAILIQNLPFWAEFYRTPNIEISLMHEWEEKIEKMIHVTSKENVTNIAGVPSWMLVLIKGILDYTGQDCLTKVWPNLELIIHGGVNFEPYKAQFESCIKKKINYLETYNASEGFFGIQDEPDSQDLLLMLDYGVFYEFIPMEDFDKGNLKTIGLEEVELNKNYALVISTNSGLWRYLIGDTIRFHSLNPFRIRITGRTKNFINAFGEELIIENVEKAIAIASLKTECLIKEYTVAPLYFSDKSQGAHEWLIEFEKEPENIDYFAEVLDNALKSLNSDYEAKRYHNMILKEPLIRIVREDTFFKWLKNNGKLGGQHKVPRLYNSRKYIDEIMSFI
ncbi:MAG: hypothetical protein A2X12_08735 [Bacteroidetes bacterium GWE2_29_8]|nr:MAG: hypothetical protein A2X12_08735 [Bacteroidetes bacterium GWE2_29_8]OFY18359.1 MAG: hypothetical protein A2X02_08455 [Bacteroidetes bacterium GWF2_29_10]